MIQDSGLLTMMALIFLAFVSILAAVIWLLVSDQKNGFDEEQARADAEEILKAAADNVSNRRRVRAGQCVGDWS